MFVFRRLHTFSYLSVMCDKLLIHCRPLIHITALHVGGPPTGRDQRGNSHSRAAAGAITIRGKTKQGGEGSPRQGWIRNVVPCASTVHPQQERRNETQTL